MLALIFVCPPNCNHRTLPRFLHIWSHRESDWGSHYDSHECTNWISDTDVSVLWTRPIGLSLVGGSVYVRGFQHQVSLSGPLQRMHRAPHGSPHARPHGTADSRSDHFSDCLSYAESVCITDDFANDKSDNISDNITNQVANRFTDDLAYDISNHLSNDVSHSITHIISNIVPVDKPVIFTDHIPNAISHCITDGESYTDANNVTHRYTNDIADANAHGSTNCVPDPVMSVWAT